MELNLSRVVMLMPHTTLCQELRGRQKQQLTSWLQKGQKMKLAARSL